MRIIFLGTPDFAVPTLEALLSWPKGELVALVCQPDRPAGRGRKLYAPPTKLLAAARGIPVFQPEKLSRAGDIVQSMRDLHPDLLVMVAFGQILKKPVLDMAPVVNLHGSLLPKYRGAAPINWAIINGETISGVTTMFSDAGVDTGDTLLKQAVAIDPEINAEELSRTLSRVGAGLIIQTLDRISDGSVTRHKQDDSEATYAPLLKKETGKIDWSKPAGDIHNLIRGLHPWPGAFTQFGADTLKIISSRVAGGNPDQPASVPGQILSNGQHVLVACGAGGKQALELLVVQPPNKARMGAKDWSNGVRLSVGVVLGSQVS